MGCGLWLFHSGFRQSLLQGTDARIGNLGSIHDHHRAQLFAGFQRFQQGIITPSVFRVTCSILPASDWEYCAPALSKAVAAACSSAGSSLRGVFRNSFAATGQEEYRQDHGNKNVFKLHWMSFILVVWVG